MIAYDCDDYNIYVHTGWKSSDDYDELMNTKNEEGLSLYFSPQIIESMVLLIQKQVFLMILILYLNQ